MESKIIEALLAKVEKQQKQIEKLIIIANKFAEKSEQLRTRIQSLEDMHFGKVDDLMEDDLPF